jgi:hypothetical protein
VIRSTTLFVRGLMRARTFSERSATHTLPAPYAIPKGLVEKEILRVTLFEPGSMRTTFPSTKSVVQTEPAAETTIPELAPTSIFTASSPAADAHVAATTAQSRPSRSPYFPRVSIPDAILQACSTTRTRLR